MCWKGRVPRDSDPQGQGHWKAPRGSKKHQGVDVAFKVGENVTSVVSGKVTKLGWPYRDPSKSNLRYVEVTKNGYRFRLHYVKPSVKVGDIVKFGDVLGTAQSTGVFYKGVTEHVHVETWNKKGKRFDPTALILSLISE